MVPILAGSQTCLVNGDGPFGDEFSPALGGFDKRNPSVAYDDRHYIAFIDLFFYLYSIVCFSTKMENSMYMMHGNTPVLLSSCLEFHVIE